MQVEKCPSCGARYDVSPFEAGATFACRRCGEAIEVGGPRPAVAPSEPGAPAKRWGLFAAGLVMLLGLFAYAHPSFGARAAKWPWVHWVECGSTMIRADLLLWTSAAVLALLAGLGIGGRHRLPVLVAVLALLLVRSYAEPSAFHSSWMELHWIACAVLLGAGFAVAAGGGAETRNVARSLMLLGALGILLIFAVWIPERRKPAVFALGIYFDEVAGLVSGKIEMREFWDRVLPYSFQFAAVLLGLVLAAWPAARAVLVRRIAAGLGFSLLLLLWLEPLAVLAAKNREAMFAAKGPTTVAQIVEQGLFERALGPWLAATLAVSAIVSGLARARASPGAPPPAPALAASGSGA